MIFVLKVAEDVTAAKERSNGTDKRKRMNWGFHLQELKMKTWNKILQSTLPLRLLLAARMVQRYTKFRDQYRF